MGVPSTETHFSVVVLCYRSEEAIIPFVEKVHRMLSYFNFTWEIILVGNYIPGTTDKTTEIVQSLSRRLSNTRCITRPKEGMMGWDMRSGMDMAEGKYIGVIDGDGQFPLESLISCLLKIEAENLDLVKTYRVRRDDGAYRGIISFIFNRIYRFLFKSPIDDVNSKPKIILKSKYKLLNLQSDDWFVDAEMMIRAQEIGLKIGSIPIHFYAISGRASFVKPAAILEFLKNLYRFRFKKKNCALNKTDLT